MSVTSRRSGIERVLLLEARLDPRRGEVRRAPPRARADRCRCRRAPRTGPEQRSLHELGARAHERIPDDVVVPNARRRARGPPRPSGAKRPGRRPGATRSADRRASAATIASSTTRSSRATTISHVDAVGSFDELRRARRDGARRLPDRRALVAALGPRDAVADRDPPSRSRRPRAPPRSSPRGRSSRTSGSPARRRSLGKGNANESIVRAANSASIEPAEPRPDPPRAQGRASPPRRRRRESSSARRSSSPRRASARPAPRARAGERAGVDPSAPVPRDAVRSTIARARPAMRASSGSSEPAASRSRGSDRALPTLPSDAARVRRIGGRGSRSQAASRASSTSARATWPSAMAALRRVFGSASSSAASRAATADGSAAKRPIALTMCARKRRSRGLEPRPQTARAPPAPRGRWRAEPPFRGPRRPASRRARRPRAAAA